MPQVRPAQPEDMPAVAEVFLAAFADSVQHVAAGPGAATALADLFSVTLRAEPGCLMVAEDERQVVGYVLSSPDIRRLRRRAFWQGGWLRLLWRALTGAYSLTWGALGVIRRDKLSFLRGCKVAAQVHARVLSLAVLPDHQGRGLGRWLFEAGLQRLEAHGCERIRLEVRPDNAPARRIYEASGFEGCGTYSDSQGAWLIMVKEVLDTAKPR